MTTVVKAGDSGDPEAPVAGRLETPSTPGGLAKTNARRTAGLVVVIALLAAICLLSIAVGTKYIPLNEVWNGLFAYDDSNNAVIIRELRVPRTVLGLIVGIALGVSGALIQAMTRNPLADPGILGVNAGAAFFVALAVGALGFTGIWSYIWFAFLGAILATVAVYALGSMGRAGATPIRLTLAGIALAAVLGGITSGMLLLDPEAFDKMRFWGAGSLSGRGLDISFAIGPFVLVGLILALVIARPLNAIALGDDLAQSLGAKVTHTRTIGIVARRRRHRSRRPHRLRRTDDPAHGPLVRRARPTLDPALHRRGRALPAAVVRRRRPSRHPAG